MNYNGSSSGDGSNRESYRPVRRDRSGYRQDENPSRYDEYRPRRDDTSSRPREDARSRNDPRRGGNQGGDFRRGEFDRDQRGGHGGYRSYNQDYRGDEYRDRARVRTQGNTERDPRDFGGYSRPSGNNYRNNQRPRNSDSYRRYDDNNQNNFNNGSNPQSNRRGSPLTTPSKNKVEEENIPREELIAQYEKKLLTMKKVTPIEEFSIIDSQWGIKPKGFENVTVQRAKLSGLFPLPGYPRPVDFTKLEGLLKDKLSNSDDILNERYRIDPLDSRNAKILIISGIDFEKADHLKVADYFNKFLAKIDIPETSLQNIESKRKTKGDKSLIIEFKNNTCATICLALNGAVISYDQIKQQSTPDEEEDDKELAETSTTIEEAQFEIVRPGEYVTQCLPPYKEIKLDEIEEVVIDNPRKITILVNEDTTDTELLDILKARAPVKSFQLLRETGTKNSIGIAFAEFYFDPSAFKNTIKVIPAIQNIIDSLQREEVIKNAFLSCVIPGKTGIEDCPMDFNSLKALAKGEYVTNHPKSRVIELINLVTPKDLVEDDNFKFIYQDILQECRTFGEVISVKIPRPANDYTPGISQFTQPGLGKVYVEFSDEQSALDAIMGLAGRMYNDRTVLCAFHNHEDFKNGLL
ncbi:hypothetical protein CAAN1_07S02938 [[Candida] anglica]